MKHGQLPLLLIFILTLLARPVLAQNIRYVSTTGTNVNPASASSWATSTTDLQGVINASTLGDTVWVANGIYKPTSTTARTISFAMKNGVTIFGGFVGNETVLSQRPPISLTTPSSTTLSGEIGNPASTGDNSYHVIRNPAGLSTTALLDGFVITAGNANGQFPNESGGGMYNGQSSSGLECSPQIRNCVFLFNSAVSGGAIFNDGFLSGTSSNPLLTNCSFQSNSATYGGAVYNFGRASGVSSPVLTNCAFQSNSATYGGVICNDGLFSGTSSPVLTNCAFQGNRGGHGGVMYNNSYSSGTSSPLLINCSFQNNSATDGGAIYNYGVTEGTSSPLLINCSFQNNSATFSGGMMYSTAYDSGTSSPMLINCVAWNNGGANTFHNHQQASVRATYTLLDASVTDYSSGNGNITTTISPFASMSSTQLNRDSPAINAGDSATTPATVGTTDLAGNPRFVNTLIDMGSYEFQQITETISLKEGAWNDPTIWSLGRLPLVGERVRLRHVITMPASFVGVGGTLFYSSSGKLIYEVGGRLQLGQ